MLCFFTPTSKLYIIGDSLLSLTLLVILWYIVQCFFRCGHNGFESTLFILLGWPACKAKEHNQHNFLTYNLGRIRVGFIHFSKILQVVHELIGNDLLDDKQYRFPASKSTADFLTVITHKSVRWFLYFCTLTETS